MHLTLVGTKGNTVVCYYYYKFRGNISLKFTKNSETIVSEFLAKFKEMFYVY